ncbi:unnamed protein product [Polarella glacialis]|uniref:RING-type domain-containing protein n=1 Tax=Polarella glacialis TaxID=89957 RepID=A0A813EMZ1_POLGL|nr:unnamed protein product [Polarella glacialis]
MDDTDGPVQGHPKALPVADSMLHVMRPHAFGRSLTSPDSPRKTSSAPPRLGATNRPTAQQQIQRSVTAPVVQSMAVRRLAGPDRQPARLPTSINRLMRNASRAIHGNQPKQDFVCKICLQSADVKTRFALEGCAAKELHAVCTGCATFYFTGRVEEKRVGDLQCPLHGSDGCTALAKDGELQKLVGEEVYQKYVRFREMTDDETLRECPICHELVKPKMVHENTPPNDDVDLEAGTMPTTQDADANNMSPQLLPAAPKLDAGMQCRQGHVFCYYHSNAHPPGPEGCEAYTLQEVKEQKLAFDALGAKECPP